MSPPTPEARQQLRVLQRALVDASDLQLRRIVAMVDAMPQRGEADELIAPLRPRLAALHVPRPITAARLLFLPLNPLIVGARGWRRGLLAIPRTALAPLATQVFASCPAVWPAAGPLRAERTDEIRRIGGTLWPEAAAFLRTAPVPADWCAVTGLQAADHQPIAALAAAGLAHAPRIDELAERAHAGHDPAEYECEELLEAAAQDDADGLAIVSALLMARLPRATPVLQAADAVAARQQAPQARQGAERAIERLLGAIEQDDPRPPGDAAGAAELRRVVCLLTDIGAMASPPPARRARIDSLRRRLDLSSRQKFSLALDTTLLRPAAALADATAPELAGLEAAARELRRFEQIARHLGGGEHYDQRLRGAAEAMLPRPGDPPATVVDRIRLIEILQGPEAALAAMPA